MEEETPFFLLEWENTTLWVSGNRLKYVKNTNDS